MAFIPKIQLQNFHNPSVSFLQARNLAYSKTEDLFVPQESKQQNNIDTNITLTPQILKILKENNIPLNVNQNILSNLQHGHLKNTRIVAAQMYSSIPAELKKEISMQDLQQAALLHDYGKILIPEKILNKHGTLNEQERKIIELHPILGYELLKNKDLNSNVLNLIKYHHQNIHGDGYPKIEDDYHPSIAADILHAADEYTALREERTYKKALSKQEALDIVKQDVEAGKISPVAYNALVKVVT